MAGKLIVIEGMDGVGTTTQAKMLAQHLTKLGFRVASSAEPTTSGLGQEIRRMLKNSTNTSDLLTSLALCFAADRMQHIHDTIKPGLKDGDFVVLDRYVLSSLVYQGLHVPTAFVQQINQFALQPDITIILDLDAQEAFKRLSSRVGAKDFYETPKMLEKIRARYIRLYEQDPSRKVLVNAQGSIEQVHAHLCHVVETPFITNKV